GTGDNQQRRQFHHAGGLIPVRQVGQRVGADRQKKLRLRMALLYLGEGIGRIARPRTVFFQLINPERRLSGDGEVGHLDADRQRGQGALLLVRRTGRRNEPDLVQPGLLPALLREDQVGQVNRVEGAAKYADSHYLTPKLSSTTSARTGIFPVKQTHTI